MDHNQNHLTIKTFMAIMAERDAAIQERNLALDERKRAFAERDIAMLQRDAALAERNSAMQQRDDALASLRFQGQNRHFTVQGQNRHFPDQGQTRHSTDQGQNRNSTDQGQNRNFTDQGQNRHFTDQGQNRNFIEQGQNRNFTDQGQNRNFIEQDLHHILQLPEETQLEEVEVSTENENPKLKGVKGQKGGRRRGESVKLEEFDEVAMAVPVCSCTGVPQPCYRWGSGGWQSACCTTNMSVYPLPQVSNKKYSRVGGRKMSGGAFSKLLTRLASEGYDLSAPLDLKEHWAKHGTNRYSTVK